MICTLRPAAIPSSGSMKSRIYTGGYHGTKGVLAKSLEDKVATPTTTIPEEPAPAIHLHWRDRDNRPALSGGDPDDPCCTGDSASCCPVLLVCGMHRHSAGLFTTNGDRLTADDFSAWNLTVNGTTRIRIFSRPDHGHFPATTGNGFAVSTVGIKYGPYICKGVLLTDLLAPSGGILPGRPGLDLGTGRLPLGL